MLFIFSKLLSAITQPLFWVAVWWGLAAGRWLLQQRPHWLQGAAPKPLAWLGRWSLTWYMLHQPAMIGALTGLSLWLGRPIPI